MCGSNVCFSLHCFCAQTNAGWSSSCWTSPPNPTWRCCSHHPRSTSGWGYSCLHAPASPAGHTCTHAHTHTCTHAHTHAHTAALCSQLPALFIGLVSFPHLRGGRVVTVGPRSLSGIVHGNENAPCWCRNLFLSLSPRRPARCYFVVDVRCSMWRRDNT